MITDYLKFLVFLKHKERDRFYWKTGRMRRFSCPWQFKKERSPLARVQRGSVLVPAAARRSKMAPKPTPLPRQIRKNTNYARELLYSLSFFFLYVQRYLKIKTT